MSKPNSPSVLLGEVAFHGNALMAVLERSDPILDNPMLDRQRAKDFEASKRRRAKIALNKCDGPTDFEFVNGHLVFALISKFLVAVYSEPAKGTDGEDVVVEAGLSTPIAGRR